MKTEKTILILVQDEHILKVVGSAKNETDLSLQVVAFNEAAKFNTELLRDYYFIRAQKIEIKRT